MPNSKLQKLLARKDVNRIGFFLIVGLILSSLAKAQDIIYEDQVFNKNVKTVRLFPLLNVPNEQNYPSAIPLFSENPLLLEFDVLFDEDENYFVKLVHCDADWTPSRLFPLDYMEEFNEFPINDYEFSFNTRVPYIHYTFLVPPVKVSGNYALVVYTNDEDDPVITRRFLVFESRVSMTQDHRNLGSAVLTRDNQEIQFKIRYNPSGLTNPSTSITTTIKQNQRWDNAIRELRPTFVNPASNEMEFRHFAGENQFQAGNQFRWFDLMSMEYFGQNVQSVDLNPRMPLVILGYDKPRGTDPYSEYRDKNGKYEIPHPFEAEYAQVEFFLESEEISDPVYVAGDFSFWRKDDYYQLDYFPERKGYYGLVLLKQGHYDYQYITASSQNPNFFEGNFFQTENEYEILIYYNSIQLGADLLIGYFNISRNPRF